VALRAARRFGLGVVLLTALQGCGIIVGGTRFNGGIVVRNNPDVMIEAEGRLVGRGSGFGRFKRGRPLQITLKQEGCEPNFVTFGKRLRTASFILSAVMTWGVYGPILDVVTGASFKPDHRNNPNVTKESYKTFIFVVDYTGCRKVPGF